MATVERLLEQTDFEVLVADADRRDAIRKGELRQGDWLRVTTRNSTYTICALGGDRYWVAGGWFDRDGRGPTTTTINGCTWGGRAIHTGLLAAPGLCLEFGNQVMTTRIEQVRVLRGSRSSRLN